MIAVRFSRTSLIAKPDFHIHAAISTCMRRRRATHRTAPSPASTSPPAASPSNKSSGTSSRNTASNPAAPTGATSSGDTKPGSATPNAPNPGPTTHPSHRPIPRRSASRNALLPRTPPPWTTRPLLPPSPRSPHFSPSDEGLPVEVSPPATTYATQSTTGDAALHPLQGERQVRPSPAETGEGSSGQPTSHTTSALAHPTQGAPFLPSPLRMCRPATSFTRVRRHGLHIQRRGGGSGCAVCGATDERSPGVIRSPKTESVKLNS